MPKRISGKYVELESRVYTRQEMSEITEIELTNKNFKRGVEKWLEIYGYAYKTIGERNCDFDVIGKADDASTKLHIMMMDELGLDRQTQPAEFAYYIYFLMTYPNAEIMPLVEQQRLIYKLYGRTYGENTFPNWTKKLDKAGAMTIDQSRNYWKTVAVKVEINGEMVRNGEKERIYIEDKTTDPDYRRYWDRLNEIMDENLELYGNRCWKKAFGQIWDEMGIYIYRTPAKLINIIGDHAQEMCDLARQVVEEDMERLDRPMPSKDSGSMNYNIYSPILL